MKFKLENPSFTNGPVEIDNKQAVKQITAYINKPIILGDEIFEINSMEEVDKIEYNGHIGTCLNYQYPHTVYLLNGKEYDVYLIFN